MRRSESGWDQGHIRRAETAASRRYGRSDRGSHRRHIEVGCWWEFSDFMSLATRFFDVGRDERSRKRFERKSGRMGRLPDERRWLVCSRKHDLSRCPHLRVYRLRLPAYVYYGGLKAQLYFSPPT